MGNKSKIEWREVSEDEYKYIKEKYARPMGALMVGMMFMCLLMIATDIRRLNCFYKRKILVTDATVQNVSVQMGTRGKTRAKVQFLTSTGVHVSMNSLGLEPLAKKGKQAFIIYFGKQDRKDWQFVVKEV